MATLAAQVTPTGIVAPTYADILAQLTIAMQTIFGSDIVLTPDSQDGQMIAVFAQAIFDANNMAVAVYNAFSPATAQGTGLSSVVKINGLKRNVSSSSTVTMTLTGQAFTVIAAGVVGDNLQLGQQWALPLNTTIPLAGTVDVTATCLTPGAVAAPSGTLTNILTPTAGWQTATNRFAAVPGAPVEQDAALRRRQSQAVALTNQSALQGIFSTIQALANVNRLAIYENDTDVVDANATPGHSLAIVVDGGSVADITTAIAQKKAPGTGTAGSVSATVTDQNGVPDVIRYYPLVQVPITVAITIKALPGFVSTITQEIQTAVAAFVSSFSIGEDSYLTRLYTPANLGGVGDGGLFFITAIQQARGANALAAADVLVAFNEAAVCTIANVAVTVT